MSHEHIGQFELIEELDQGTVGTVYRARHVATAQPAAIKLLQPHVAHDPEVQRRFVREVAICQQLDHPNIVRHFDCGLHEGQIFFAMELVDSGTLKDILIRRRALPWREAVECAIQICEALQYAHELGVIHRDLKPGNLFLAEDGRIKIGDFGLARDLHRVRLTLEGRTVGTCRYMPPEQIAGEEELTGAVDLYALGCILFEMIAGHTPFDGETIVEIFDHHLDTPPPRLRKLVSGCPQDLSTLVTALLAKSPNDRPCDAQEVRGALMAVLDGTPMQFSTPSSGEADQASSTVEASTVEYELPGDLTARLHSGPVRPGSYHRQWIFWVLSLLLVAGVVGLGLLLTR